VIPLVQVLAIAGLAWFPVLLTSPVLLAVGANRDRVMADLIGRSVSAAILCSSAWFGIMAMAASKLLTLPYQMVLSLCFVRRHIAFRWREVWAALWKSAVVTAATAAGPICVVALSDWSLDLSITASLAAVLLAASGWLLGVLATQHPVLPELRKAADELAETALVRRGWRLRDRIIALRLGAGEAR
jgi:O-antigen/teichoic acid export membrane protein